MNTVTNYVSKINGFFKIGDKRGVTAIEYGLIAALISLVIVGAATGAGKSLKSMFTQISTSMTKARSTAQSGQ